MQIFYLWRPDSLKLVGWLVAWNPVFPWSWCAHPHTCLEPSVPLVMMCSPTRMPVTLCSLDHDVLTHTHVWNPLFPWSWCAHPHTCQRSSFLLIMMCTPSHASVPLVPSSRCAHPHWQVPLWSLDHDVHTLTGECPSVPFIMMCTPSHAMTLCSLDHDMHTHTHASMCACQKRHWWIFLAFNSFWSVTDVFLKYYSIHNSGLSFFFLHGQCGRAHTHTIAFTKHQTGAVCLLLLTSTQCFLLLVWTYLNTAFTWLSVQTCSVSGGGFFLAFVDLRRKLDHSFSTSVFFFLKWRLARTH